MSYIWDMNVKSGKGEWIYGRRPVREIMIAGRRQIYELALADMEKDAAELALLRSVAQQQGIMMRRADRRELDLLAHDGNHQGVAVRVGGYPYIGLAEVADLVVQRREALVLILDHLEDPQNLGSLLRTAEAAGVSAVVIPEDRAVAVTPAVTRASAGAAEHVRVTRVVNLVRAIEILQKAGLWIVGLDTEGADVRPYTEIDFRERIGLVVGGEGHGLRRLTRAVCDFIAVLPMHGAVASLNAGVAGAICLYEALRQRASDPAGGNRKTRS